MKETEKTAELFQKINLLFEKNQEELDKDIYYNKVFCTLTRLGLLGLLPITLNLFLQENTNTIYQVLSGSLTTIDIIAVIKTSITRELLLEKLENLKLMKESQELILKK